MASTNWSKLCRKTINNLQKRNDREIHWPERQGHVSQIELEWSMRTIRDDGESPFSTEIFDPGYKAFLFCEAGKNLANWRMKWEYYQPKAKKSLSGVVGWIDAMQSWVSPVVYILSPDAEEFHLMYPFQKSDKHVQILGKLCRDHYFTKIIQESAAAYFKKF